VIGHLAKNLARLINGLKVNGQRIEQRLNFPAGVGPKHLQGELHALTITIVCVVCHGRFRPTGMIPQ